MSARHVATLISVATLLNLSLLPATGADLAQAGPGLRYVEGSTRKVQQLIGDIDKETGKPTLSQTNARFGVEGTDLGASFEIGDTTVLDRKSTRLNSSHT